MRGREEEEEEEEEDTRRAGSVQGHVRKRSVHVSRLRRRRAGQPPIRRPHGLTSVQTNKLNKEKKTHTKKTMKEAKIKSKNFPEKKITFEEKQLPRAEEASWQYFGSFYVAVGH